MGASVGKSDGDDLTQVSDINVTPFIDVMLVLLIIFMIAAPLATVDVAVELPASTAQRQQRPNKPVFLTIRHDRSLHLGENAVARDLLGVELDRLTAGDKQQRLFLRADKRVPYGDMMDVMNAVRAAGYLKVALVGLDSAPVP